MSDKPDYNAVLQENRVLAEARTRLEETCRFQQKAVDLLNAIRKAQSLYITDTDPSEIYQLLLQTLVETTESEYGFLDEVLHDNQGNVFKKNLAISNISWDAHSSSLYRQLQDRDLKFPYLDNLAGFPALTGEIIISNHPERDPRYRGLPEGHPQIQSFLGVPLYFGGSLIGVAGVANRDGGYDESMAAFLEPLFQTCASITYAFRKEAQERENERKLRESEEKYRLIVENQNDLVVKFAADLNILFVSPSYCKTFGFEEQALIGHTFLSLVHEDDRDAVRASIKKLNSPPYQTYHEERAKTLDGWRWFGWSLRAALADSGHISEIIAVGRDITERVEAEKALAQSRKKFQTVADFTYDWEYWRAPKGHFIYVSPSCRRITGYRPEEFMAHPKLLEAILHPEDLPAFRENEKNAAESGKPGEIEFRIISKAGDERCIGHICRPVYDEEDRFIGTRASNRDITEQKRLQQESEQAHKMEAIGTLAGGIAHQFNNALSVIQGMLELLEEDFSENDTISAYVGEMKEASGRMERLTAQLLAYARGGKYRAETLSLNHFINDTIPILHHGVRPDIAIETELLEKDVRVHVDQTQMQMTLSAVLSNASEAIEGSGRIRIRSGHIRVGADPAKDPPDLSAGDYVRITVSDDGRGMDEKTRSRVFEPFFTTKFQGRGLGMAAAFGIVSNHNGSISLASSPGKGTAVSIYLPAVEITGGDEAMRQARQAFDISGL